MAANEFLPSMHLNMLYQPVEHYSICEIRQYLLCTRIFLQQELLHGACVNCVRLIMIRFSFMDDFYYRQLLISKSMFYSELCQRI
ncbi:hypothetical protein C1H84_14535 [Glutamicibacter soli]|uniref:Uncharacterized protein n=1 Tax=Glutamicibacter soli TaxID=453836 RepID=A0A365YBD0_9MICC|nr:hypothetical protein C1H84_14535 [Glutamicibacter soli]